MVLNTVVIYHFKKFLFLWYYSHSLSFSNKMILSFLFYKIQQGDQPHKWNIHSRTRRQTVQIYQEADRGQNPRSILPHTKGPQHQTHITTSWQNVPMPLCVHKWSSMVDTHQNLLTKGPNASLCLRMVLHGRHTSQPVGIMPKRHCALTKCPQRQIQVKLLRAQKRS